MDRRLDWAACTNIRDLGGLSVASGSTSWRSVVRADNLNRLTDAGRESLLDYGIRTIIDLRDPRELAGFPYPFRVEDLPGVTIVNAPLISSANWDWYARGEVVEHPYVKIAELSAANIVAALRGVALAGPGGVVVHCHEGRERTGIIAAIQLELAGVADGVIADDWVASMPDSMTPVNITAVLDYMRRSGGSVGEFLIHAGLHPVELDALRVRLRG